MDKLTVSASMGQLRLVSDFVEAGITAAGGGQENLRKILVAVDELFSNIVRYAYGGGAGEAEISLEVKDGVASVCFVDSGIPYNPLEKEDPDVELSAEERRVGGLGVYMVKKSMDAVEYEHRDGKNVLTIRKKL